MKSLVRVGALAALNLFCCSGFAEATNVINNTKLQSNIYQNHLIENRISQNVIPANLKDRLYRTSRNTEFASFLPSDAPLVATMDTSSATWKKAGKFQLFQTVWNGISFLIPPQFKNGYATDIQPWLGEQVAFAFLPKNGSSQVTIESNFVTLLPVKDAGALQRFLDKLTANGNFNRREYKGITVLKTTVGNSAKPGLPRQDNTIPPVPKSPLNKASKSNIFRNPNLKTPSFKKPNLNKRRDLVIGVLPGHLAIGYSNQTIERVINTSKNKSQTLTQNSQFYQTITQPQTGKPLFAMYQDPVGYLGFLKEIIKDPGLGLSNINLDNILSPEQLKQYKSIGSFLTVQKEGIRFQINAYPSSPNRNKLAANINRPTILSRMAAATYSAINGKNLNIRWQTISKLLSVQKDFKGGLKTLRELIRSNTGLDLDRDIMSWMDGEFAFFMYPTKGGFFQAMNPNLNMGIGLAVETSNRTTAENTLNKLGNLIASVSKGEVKVAQKSIKNQAVTSWDVEGDSAKSLLAYRSHLVSFLEI